MRVTGVRVRQGAGFHQGDNGTENRRISPNGKYLVGEKTSEHHSWGLDIMYGYTSFLHDMETGTTEWITSYDESDWSKLGSFADVSNGGTICGTTKDSRYMLTLTDWGETFTLPLNSAAIWTSSGNVKSLGIGTYTAGDFKNFNDGSFATSISRDGKVVAGYVAIGNSAYIYPCRWTLDEETGEYAYEAYAIPAGCSNAQVNDLSGDGSVAVGYYNVDGKYHPCYWPSADKCVEINDGTLSGYQGCKAFCISDNGKYIGLTLDRFTPTLYAVATDEYRSMTGLGETKSVEIGGITDSGEMFGSVSFAGGSKMPFWYSYPLSIVTGFDYFTYRTASGIDIPYNFNRHSGESLSLSSVSADGTVIAGNDSYGSPWILKTDGSKISYIPPTVNSFDVAFAGIGQATVSFSRGMEASYHFFAKEYVIYRDGSEVGRVSIDELDAKGAETVTFTDTDISGGTHYYTVAINWIGGGGKTELLSPKSEERSLYMDMSFEFPLYDNFDSNSISTNGWSVQKDYGETDYQNWGCAQYMGLNSTSCLHSTVDQLIPYSYSVVSRHLDATGRDAVYISFGHYWEYMNSRDWELDQDSLSLEICSDGTTWETVKDYPLCDFPAYHMTFDYIDLTPYAANKMFQVRFRLHGQAKAMFSFRIENLTIDEKPQHEGTAGVMGFTGSDGKFHLTWKNSLDAYQLCYLGNPYNDAVNQAIGNEGKELIAVNKFDVADLSAYKDKYLTSISTNINKYESEDNTPIRVAVVVYEDGMLIREQELAGIEYNADLVAILDEPVLIDGTKDLMFGLKVLEHGADQCPVPYQDTEDYVQGKSDLYSEDGGKTWRSASEFFAENPDDETGGQVSWLITGNVTDTPEVTKDKIDINQYCYEVYKNGSKLSKRLVYLLEPGFTDEESVTGDVYEVRTFFYDGTCTELSNTVTNDGTTGIGEVEAARGEGGWTIDNGRLTVDGDVEKIELYNAEGMKLYEGESGSMGINGFGHGLFILKAYTAGGGSKSYKLAL